MRLTRLVAIIAMAGFGLACSESTTPGGSNVSVDDDVFNPETSTVSAGATVTWTWNGSNDHNVTWDGGTPAASPTQSSGTYSRTFPTAGTFDYHCTVHGAAAMSGSVVVQ
jgi:plastocyanin